MDCWEDSGATAAKVSLAGRVFGAAYPSGVIVALTLCASFGAAQAQSARQACRPDYQAFCSGVQPGGGQIIACLQRNMSKLAPDCQAALQKVKPQQ